AAGRRLVERHLAAAAVLPEDTDSGADPRGRNTAHAPPGLGSVVAAPLHVERPGPEAVEPFAPVLLDQEAALAVPSAAWEVRHLGPDLGARRGRLPGGGWPFVRTGLTPRGHGEGQASEQRQQPPATRGNHRMISAGVLGGPAAPR